MGELIFIIGGTRSGKSQQAQKLAAAYGQKVGYLATCIPGDEEMAQRVLLHQKNRPSHWETIEAPREVVQVLRQDSAGFEAIVIDCLTLWIFNLMEIHRSEAEILTQVEQLCEVAKEAKAPILLVSDEVGGGIVPDNALARKFRDVTGGANQIVARHAAAVYWMVAGIPVKIK